MKYLLFLLVSFSSFAFVPHIEQFKQEITQLQQTYDKYAELCDLSPTFAQDCKDSLKDNLKSAIVNRQGVLINGQLKQAHRDFEQRKEEFQCRAKLTAKLRSIEKKDNVNFNLTGSETCKELTGIFEGYMEQGNGTSN